MEVRPEITVGNILEAVSNLLPWLIGILIAVFGGCLLFFRERVPLFLRKFSSYVVPRITFGDRDFLKQVVLFAGDSRREDGSWLQNGQLLLLSREGRRFGSVKFGVSILDSPSHHWRVGVKFLDCRGEEAFVSHTHRDDADPGEVFRTRCVEEGGKKDTRLDSIQHSARLYVPDFGNFTFEVSLKRNRVISTLNGKEFDNRDLELEVGKPSRVLVGAWGDGRPYKVQLSNLIVKWV